MMNSDSSIDTSPLLGSLNNAQRIIDPNYIVLRFRGNRSLRIRRVPWNVFLSALTVFSSVLMVVTLPLYSQSMTQGTNDEYPVIFLSAMWFPIFLFMFVFINKYRDPQMSLKSNVSHKVMALVGSLNAINGILVVYASDPSRTPPALQAILSAVLIPFTVICRYIFLRKGVSNARLVCTGVVLTGLFISVEPVIFNIDQGDGVNSAQENSSIMKIVWPIIFMLGFLPLAILNVILEKELKKDETESLVFLAWSQLYQVFFVGLLFWTDFLPHFGAAGSFSEFKNNMKQGIDCQYGRDPMCSSAVLYSWLFIISYVFANLMVFLLVKFSEGAVYLVVVQALQTPLGALFWTFFNPSPGFHWEPVFNLTTFFTVLGLAVMVPAVIMYNHFGEAERKDDQEHHIQRDK